jgi:hypothetical protein
VTRVAIFEIVSQLRTLAASTSARPAVHTRVFSKSS